MLQSDFLSENTIPVTLHGCLQRHCDGCTLQLISIFRRESACCDRVECPDRLMYCLLIAAKEVSELGAIVVVVNATQCSIRPQRQVSWWLLCLEFRREYVSNFGKLKSLSSLGARCGCCAAVLYCQSGGRGGVSPGRRRTGSQELKN